MKRVKKTPEEVATQKAEYYQRNKERIKAKARESYADDPEIVRKRVEKYRKHNPQEIAKRKQLAYLKLQDTAYQSKYGMTLGDIEGMLVDQDFKCGVCGDLIDIGSKRVDHCHTTGFVRGLLCWNCNTAIGKLGDTEAGVLKALRYLQKPMTRFKGTD